MNLTNTSSEEDSPISLAEVTEWWFPLSKRGDWRAPSNYPCFGLQQRPLLIVKPQIKEEQCFLLRVARFSLRDRVRTWLIQKYLGEELLMTFLVYLF